MTQPQSQNQAKFFLMLKSTLPSYSSLVDEIAETLDLSIDSAYRRIRGEKLLDFQELEILCKRFNVSLDKFFSLSSDSIVFQGQLNKYGEDGLTLWLEDMLDQLNRVNSFSNKHIYFSSKTCLRSIIFIIPNSWALKHSFG